MVDSIEQSASGWMCVVSFIILEASVIEKQTTLFTPTMITPMPTPMPLPGSDPYVHYIPSVIIPTL